MKSASIPNWLTHVNPSNMHEPEWYISLRKHHWQDFLLHGLPDRSDERWKYTDLTWLDKRLFETPTDSDVSAAIADFQLQQEHLLLVMVNGCYQPQFTDQTKIPKGVIICGMHEALKQHETLIKTILPKPISASDYPFASLNAALFSDGIFIYVPDDCIFKMPIQLLSLATYQNEFIAHPKHVVIAGERSQFTLLEEYGALTHQAYMMNIVTHIFLKEDAQIDHYKIQNEHMNAIHMAHTFIHQAKSSRMGFTNFSFGSLFARDDMVVKLEGRDAECRTSGFYRLQQDNQYVDHHIDIDHIGKRTSSEMLYKGILDKKSRAVFNGRLHVHKDAQKILAHQANHNLLLSNQAEVYSKPELVINADDVKCKHGATTGQLDQDALFYLRSRGIELDEAMAMLTRGFADEIMKRVSHPSIKKRVRDIYEK